MNPNSDVILYQTIEYVQREIDSYRKVLNTTRFEHLREEALTRISTLQDVHAFLTGDWYD